MGLGKTLEALALICHARQADPASAPFLVVAPTSVAPNWAAESARFTPGLKVVTITDTLARSGAALAVPQIGAVLVPINYRLAADDFAYLINHSGARVVCAHSDFLDPIERGYAAGFRKWSISSLSKGHATAGWITNPCSGAPRRTSSGRTSRKATC